MGLTAKVKVLAGQQSFPEAPGENPFPGLFLLLEATHIPWFVTPSSEPAKLRLSGPSVITSPSDSDFSQERLFQGLVYKVGPTHTMQDNLSISGSLFLMASAKAIRITGPAHAPEEGVR